MKSTTSKKLLTCIVPHGRALPVLKLLKEEHGIITANIYHARGAGRMTPMAWRGIGETTEKDVMTVVVDKDDCDKIFAYIYEKAGIDQPHGGILYQQSLKMTTDFTLPEVPTQNKQ